MILITNDDGIVAPGIKNLVHIAAQFDEVIVVAPDSPQSGQGHAITLNQPLRLRKVDIFDGIDAYECNGTPVDCVKLAKNVLLKGKNIDLCLSGINHGANASIDIIYSGTMSAAMEASLEGIPSIGFSLLDFSFDADFSASAPFISALIGRVIKEGMGTAKLLNVNIPNVPRHHIKGVKVCRQAMGTWVEEFKEGIDPRGEKYYWLTGKFVSYEGDHTDHDIWSLDNDYISIVPSHHDLTDYKSLGSLGHLEAMDL